MDLPAETPDDLGLSGMRLVCGSRVWSASEVEKAASTLAATLADAGAGPGLRIVHSFALEPLGAVALAAIERTGATTVMAAVSATERERLALLDATDPSIVLAPSDAARVPPGWTTRTSAVAGFGSVAVSRGDPRPPDRDPDGGEVLLLTSGTSGTPKVVSHRWWSLQANAEAANRRLDFDSEGTWLATLGWSHVGGLAIAVRVAAARATLAFGPGRFVAEDVAEALEGSGATHVSLVPAMLHRLLDLGCKPSADLRVALLGGAATPRRLAVRAAEAGWPIALTYGLSEAGSQVATAMPDEVQVDPDSVGQPLEGVDVRILEARDRDGMGEIQIRGSTLFRGYRGDTPRSADAWFSTGDLGRVDGAGRLYVLGRDSDRIVSGGVNIDPSAVETVLAEHPDVRDVAVVGLLDPVFGEIVTAAVVLAVEDLPLELEAWARERLSGAFVPRRWSVLRAIPRTAVGKVDRAAVRAALGEEASR